MRLKPTITVSTLLAGLAGWIYAARAAAVEVESVSGVSGDSINLIGYLAGGAAGVVAVVAWVDHRMDKRVEQHEVLEEIRAEQRHSELLGVIERLQERLVDHGVIPGPTPSGSWPVFKKRGEDE